MSRTVPTPEELREMIDGALEEIERTELEMLDVLADVLGPESAKRVADQIAAQSEAPRFARLLSGEDPSTADRARRGERSTGAREDTTVDD